MIAFNFQTRLISKKLRHWEIKFPTTLFTKFLPYTGFRNENTQCSTVLHTLGQNNLRYIVLHTSVAPCDKSNSVSPYARQ